MVPHAKPATIKPVTHTLVQHSAFIELQSMSDTFTVIVARTCSILACGKGKLLAFDYSMLTVNRRFISYGYEIEAITNDPATS